MEFITHNKEIVTGLILQKALNKVATDWENLGFAIKKSNDYAPHVSEQVKKNNLKKHLETANEIRFGIINSFTIWQRVNEELTGKCVALFQPNKTI